MQDINDRTFEFAVRIVALTSQLPRCREADVIGKQLLRSGTSIGANVEEASAAFSKDDFTFKMNTALKEARETHYWLKLIQRSELVTIDRLHNLMTETQEIKNILGSIVSKMKRRPR